MRVVMHRVKESTLESFADEHGLTLEIHERSDPRLERYYAHFDNVEVMCDGMLCGTFGNGDTPAAARPTLSSINDSLAALERLRIETLRSGSVRPAPGLHPVTHEFVLGAIEALEWAQGEHSAVFEALP